MPKHGIYISPIIALDFASLYPSIIIAANLSPETVLEKEDENSKKIKVPFGISTESKES